MNSRENNSICLLEHDMNGDTLVTWSYPGVPSHLQALCIDKFNQHFVDQGSESVPLLYFKMKSDWVYMNFSVARKDMHTEITSSALCVVTKTFNPEKYQVMLKVLHEQFLSSGDPTKILEGYLSVHATGKFKAFDMANFRDEDAQLSECCLKEIIRMLGLEAVVLWNAVLLKKRILVSSDGGGHQNISKLLATLRCLPQLALHRRDWGVLRPLVSSSGEEGAMFVEDLSSCGVFIAGTMDPAMATTHAALFDVVFSLTDHRITINDAATASMRMGSTHRELAQQLVDLESSVTSTDQDMLKLITAKTDKIIKNLHSLTEEGTKLTEQAINDAVSNEATQQWLARVAIAEGLL
mmetsp:Transcript_17122/g.28607  ORF Transcript_17122/g.28607 Transcript_17122/m.28607 type:complete len:352 (+) Transcript_17122:49-1104(+)